VKKKKGTRARKITFGLVFSLFYVFSSNLQEGDPVGSIGPTNVMIPNFSLNCFVIITIVEEK